jgi:hypothetical protein
MMVAGIVCLSVGGVAILGGLATVALAERRVDCGGFGCNTTNTESDIVRGGLMIGFGGAAVVVGAILTPLGARKVRIDPATSLTIEPLVGPNGAGLRVRF